MYFIAFGFILINLFCTIASQQGSCPRNFGTISSSTFISLDETSPVSCVLNIRAKNSIQGRIKLRFISGLANASHAEVNIVDDREITTYNMRSISGKSYNSKSNRVKLRIFSDSTTVRFIINIRIIVVFQPKQELNSTLLLPNANAATVATEATKSTTSKLWIGREPTPSSIYSFSPDIPSTGLTTTKTNTTLDPGEKNYLNVQIKGICAPATFTNRGINVSFPATRIYNLALSTSICENGRPEGTAVCSTDQPLPQTHSSFQSVHALACNVTFSNLKTHISRQVLADLVVLTSLPALLTAENFTDAVEILQIASNQVEVDREVMIDVTNIISNLANEVLAGEKGIAQASSLGALLLSSLNAFATRSLENFQVITPSIEVQATETSFPNNTTSNSDLLFRPVLNKSDSSGSVAISDSYFNQAALKNSSIYTLFAEGIGFSNQFDCKSQIIGIGTRNSSESNFSYNMSFGRYEALHCVDVIKSRNQSRIPSRCSFGQLKKLDEADWKTESSCELQLSGEFSCKSPGTFALFFTTVRIPHALELSIFTFIGCGISVVFLIITVSIHLAIREVRKKATTTFQLNICFCLLALYFFFAVGITMTSHGPTCDFMAFAIQFFVLATFAWMSANSYKMLRIFAQFTYDIQSHITIVSIFSYGLPFAISLISYLISLNRFDRLYENPNAILLSEHCKTNGTEKIFHACWLHGDLQIYGFLIPVGICLIFNFVIFVILMKIVIFRKKTIRSSRKERKKKDKIINAVAMATMMGLTWIIGFFLLFTENEFYQLVVQWIFSIVNTLLGVMIFYLSCLRRRDIQKLWVPESVRRLGVARKTTYYIQSTPSSQFNASFHRRRLPLAQNSNFNESIYRSKRFLPEPTSTAL